MHLFNRECRCFAFKIPFAITLYKFPEELQPLCFFYFPVTFWTTIRYRESRLVLVFMSHTFAFRVGNLSSVSALAMNFLSRIFACHLRAYLRQPDKTKDWASGAQSTHVCPEIQVTIECSIRMGWDGDGGCKDARILLCSGENAGAGVENSVRKPFWQLLDRISKLAFPNITHGCWTVRCPYCILAHT